MNEIAAAVEELGSMEAVEAEARRLAEVIYQTIHRLSQKMGDSKCL